MVNKILSISEYDEIRNIVYFLGIKIKYPKPEYLKLKKQNSFYKYKKEKFPITEIPPATGQIRDIQLANLVLLKELDYVCKQANIRYWLDYGTLLGAVRHKGYIPWDDDIDIGMIWEDYQNIFDVFDKYSKNPDIYLEKSKDNHNNAFIKVRHRKCKILFVDIFPYKEISGRINSQTIITEWHYKDEIFPLNSIEYEGEKYLSVNNPDKYLTNLYGKYMQYPKKLTMGHAMYLKLSEQDKNIIRDLINRN